MDEMTPNEEIATAKALFLRLMQDPEFQQRIQEIASQLVENEIEYRNVRELATAPGYIPLVDWLRND